ncbi:hypothetical protein ABLO26_08900 [Neobacillus sp. 179-J 1A1 HS]|uniref:hypothetical protein n=1 Tax=Neobacillus driksii TaxID=3035913 RepID=UPI0035BC8DC7
MKSKRNNKLKNTSHSNSLPKSEIYMGRKIAAGYSSLGAVSNNGANSDSRGCGCGKPKQLGVKHK